MIDLSLHRIVTFIDGIRSYRLFRCVSLVEYLSSLYVCRNVRKSKRNNTMTWIESLIMCFVGEFGGTTIASIIIGEPIRFLRVDSIVLGLLLAWLTIYCAPFDWGIRVCESPIVLLICKLFFMLNINYSITIDGVDAAIKADPTLSGTGISLLIAAGTIAGCGGMLLLHYFNVIPEEWNKSNEKPILSPIIFPTTEPYSTEDMNDMKSDRNSIELSFSQDITSDHPPSLLPNDLIRPTFTVKRSFFATILYIFLLDPFHLLRGYAIADEETCHFITLLFFISTSLLKSMGWNIFDSVSSLFHDVTQIPRDIPVLAQRWSFEQIREKAKEM